MPYINLQMHTEGYFYFSPYLLYGILIYWLYSLLSLVTIHWRKRRVFRARVLQVCFCF